MISILNMKLESVKTEEAFLINKRDIDGDSLKITLSRSIEEGDSSRREYIGRCSAELKLTAEENNDFSDRTFYTKISVVGVFTCNSPSEEVTEEELRSSTMFELLPHVRAQMATLMASAGVTPYIIPNSIIPELS